MSNQQNLKSKLILLISTLCITFLVFTLNDQRANTQLSNTIGINRRLGEDEPVSFEEVELSKIAEICKEAPEDVFKHFFPRYYAFENQIDAKTVQDPYPKDTKKLHYSGKSAVFKYLKKTIGGDDEGDDEEEDASIMDVIKSAVLYLIFLILAVITLIAWVPCCCCFCCNGCCCCKKKLDECCCKCVTYLLMLGCLAAILGLAIYGLSSTKKIIKDFNGVSCSLLSVFTTLVNGEGTAQTPKWTGIKGLHDVLGGTEDAMDEITKDSDLDDVDEIEDKELDFDNYMDTTVLSNYNNDADNNFVVLREGDDICDYIDLECTTSGTSIKSNYIKALGKGDEDLNTFYGNQRKAFHDLAGEAKQIIKDANEAAKSSEEISGLGSSIEEAENTIDDLGQQFYDLYGDLSAKIFDYREYITKYANKALLAFFGIFIGLSALLILFGTMIVCTYCCCLKFLSCIFINISICITFFNFIFAALVGIVGFLFVEGSDLIKYTLSEENLNSTNPFLLEQGDSIDKINTCISGDGNLANYFDALKNATSSLDTLVKLDSDIKDARKQLNEKRDSLFNLEEMNKDLLKKSGSFELFASNDDGDSTLKISYKLKATISGAFANDPTNCKDDTWADDEQFCDGKPIAKEDGTWDGPKYCFLFNKFESGSLDSKIAERYTDCKTPSNVDLINIINAYRNDVKKLRLHYNTVAGNAEIINNAIISKFDAVIGVMDGNFEKQEIKIHNINNTFGSLLGDGEGGVSSLINCKFLGVNFKIIIDELENGFGKRFKKVGTILGVISILFDAGLFCFILTFNKMRPDKEQEKEKENEEPKKEEYQSINSNSKKDLQTAVPGNNMIETEGIQVNKFAATGK